MLDFFLGRSPSSLPFSAPGFAAPFFVGCPAPAFAGWAAPALLAAGLAGSFPCSSLFFTGGCTDGSGSVFLLAVFPPVKFPFTMSITSSSIALLAVFFTIFFSFKNSIMSFDCIFNSFAIS